MIEPLIEDAGAPARAALTAPLAPAARPRSLRAVLAAGFGIALVLALALGGRATVQQTVTPARGGIAAIALLASLRANQATSSVPVPPVTATPARTPAPPAVRKAVLSTPARAVSACDPPYYLDATGIRRVKRECL